MTQQTTASQALDGRGDFDFLFGQWTVRHRRIADVLDPECTEWREFDSTCEARPVLGGIGNVDTLSATLPDGLPMEGMSLRLYDPEADLWRIWWSSTTRPGRLDPPVEGRFRDGVGVFLGPDTIGGRPALVRYRWSMITPTSARWEQDFSYDDGATWDPVNWVMTFVRRAG
ncbi:hypothetical protein AB0F81_03585 [Actinoplanes sp. NPDC024001]|uniref:hypothetical protein n=1 Tax=Actinoplanes sp. NPDC024001 TaxID=3154598 RepID=UPI00340DE790